MEKLIGLALFYILIVNLWLFTLMWIDKRKAKKGAWRIPEKKLWTLALCGGVFGGWVAMRIFRHKTKHRLFAYGFPLLNMVYMAIIIYATIQFYTQ